MLYIFDNTETLITTLPKGSFFNAVHYEVLNGENIFEFTVPAGSEYVVEGNLVAFRDLDSYWQVFEIKRIVDVHGDGLTRTAYCEHIFYELLDDIVTDKRPSAGATAALAGMLENTRWQVGTVDDLGASSTSAYYIPALEAVQKVAEAWQGELNWRCVINGGVITRYVDLLAMRGTDTGKQFAYSKDILNIEREVDSSGVVTALYGRGKGVETESGAYGRRLTFADVIAADKPAGQEWIGDSDALAQWGRPGGRHRFGVFVDEEETDPAVLLQKTRDELARRKVPRATYRLDVVSLEELTGYEHEKVRLGDLVRVIDREFEPELVVSARVIEIERDILDPANTKVVLGSFAPTIVEATINTARRVNDMANRPFNTKWLDGKISVLQNEIENVQSYVFQTAEDGILVLDAPTYDQATKAMKLGGGMFAIANQKDGNGGWNWRTFGDGSGFTADLITAGIIDAGLVQIGPETTFAPGYDPTLIDPSASATMGVDSDCLGLWHFDGSLNSHKGVAAIGDANFDAGCFGQAVEVTTPFDGDVSTGKESGMSASSMYSSAYSPDNLVDGSIVFGAGTAFASASGAAFPQWHQIDLGGVFSINKVRWINNRNTANLPKDYTIAISKTGAFAGEEVVVIAKTGNATYSTWVEHAFTAIKGRYVRMTVSAVVSGAYYELSEWQIYSTRLGVLKAPTTGLSPNQSTINFRAKNLAESGNGSVLVDLPKSDNSQGIKAGIANDGKLYITDSDKVSRSYTETSQADFQSGTLTDVVATSAGDLELKQTMGKALSFDGVDDYVDCGSNLNTTSQMTIETKIKINDYSKERVIISNNLGAGSNQYALRVGVSGKLTAGISTASKNFWVADICEIEKNTKIHLASVFDTSNNKYAVYKNGSTVASGTLTDAPRLLVTGKTFIGKDNRNKGYFDGIIDDVRIWNVARTQQQIQDNMNKELVGNETGLVGYWKFNEGTGTTAYDSTANGNNGTINGATWVNTPYNNLGTREKIVDLSGANPTGGTKIEWSKTTPTGTAVKVETALSTDGGSTYGAYQEATSGNSIPGITSATDLSNARLKIKETLSTTDTSVTPKLHSLTFTIWEKQATTAYGPNKSTLTAWDSISLAWKPERLSLVVNDTEACYIENPGLPASLGSYVFIGTDRNGANAINTLVDELRIDKVYRDVNIRTAWHKTGVPFYTSEDMKQWPGYMRAETDGLKVYDSSDALRVLVGSWIKDQIRKYGIKIIDGEIYSSIIRSGAEDATTYIQLIPPSILQVVKDGKQLLRIDTTAEHGLIDIFNAEGLDCGRLGGANDRDLALTNVSGKIFIVGQTGVDCMYGINVTGGVKNCIEDTIYGKLGISARESPEVRYIDEGMGTLVNGECRIDIDPIFMECIEPHTPDSRWYIQLTPYADVDLYVSEIGDGYFIIKERKGGTSTGAEFTWSLSATRKDYALIRFMEVLD